MSAQTSRVVKLTSMKKALFEWSSARSGSSFKLCRLPDSALLMPPAKDGVCESLAILISVAQREQNGKAIKPETNNSIEI